MKGLSKSRIFYHRQCPRRLWLYTHRNDLAEDSSYAQATMDAGTDVGELACTLFPGGILIEEENLSDALGRTDETMKNPTQTIYEATLQAGGVLVKVDILAPVKEGYRLIEVKSAGEVKDYHLEDAAIQAWVLDQAGTKVSSVEIGHINKSFVYPGGGDYNGLFTFADITEDSDAIKPQVAGWIKEARDTVAGSEPDIPANPQCFQPFDCPFHKYCFPDLHDLSKYPPEILPRDRNGASAMLLRAHGYEDLKEAPEGLLTNANHERVRRVTASGKAELNPGAAAIIKGWGYPRYYLDFETIFPAVPLYKGTHPYQQVPFQWSCHVEKVDGTMTHKSFLADGRGDPRPEFVETLLEAVSGAGPIVVYNAGFENSRLAELAKEYPGKGADLSAVISRVVDLLPVTRDHYYHPDMRGSWSIKAVLPTIAPDLDYGELLVSDGGMAGEAYLEMIRDETTDDRRNELREGLLKYCERDTLAMVLVLKCLVHYHIL